MREEWEARESEMSSGLTLDSQASGNQLQSHRRGKAMFQWCMHYWSGLVLTTHSQAACSSTHLPDLYMCYRDPSESAAAAEDPQRDPTDSAKLFLMLVLATESISKLILWEVSFLTFMPVGLAFSNFLPQKCTEMLKDPFYNDARCSKPCRSSF